MNQQQTGIAITGPLNKLETPTVGDDGLVPHDQWDKPLLIHIHNSPNIIEGCVIQLLVNTAPSPGFEGHTVLKSEAENPDFTFEFLLPLEFDKDRRGQQNDPVFGNPAVTLSLTYSVVDPVTGATTSPPSAHKIIFDKQPPGAEPPSYIGFTAEQMAGVYASSIKEGYFSGPLVAWPGMSAGDVMTPWLGTAEPDPGAPVQGLLPESQVTIGPDDVGRSVDVRFPESALAALGNTVQYFGYQLQDKLGNTSSISQTRYISVDLTRTRAQPKKPSVAAGARIVRVNQAPGDDLNAPVIANLRPSDGRIRITDLAAPIVVTIEMPAKPIAGAQSQIYVNGYNVPGNAIGSPVDVPDTGTSYELRIATADFPKDVSKPVEWLVDYSYADPFNDPNFSYKPVTLIFDRTAPGGAPRPGPIAFTQEQLEGITQDDIDQTSKGLNVHISAWNDEDIDDQVQLWLGSSPSDGTYLSDLPAPVTDSNKGVDVVFPLAELEKITTNPAYFGWRVTDWAGNVSSLSELVAIELYLTDTDLLAPIIPDAEPYNPYTGAGPAGTGLLVWTEANPVTTVQIPFYDTAVPDDRVYISWNGTAVVPPLNVKQTDIDNASANGYLLNVEVPFSFTQDSSGDNIFVSYDVHPTGGGPAIPSPKQYINVNLTTPGGPNPDPDPTTPEHDNLLPLKVLSVLTGSRDNIIPIEAYELAANITVPRVGQDTNPIWLVGDTLNIYWGPDHDDDPVPILIDATNEGSNIIVPLPAGFIKTNGTGDIPVYYTLTRDLGNDNLVTVKSVATPVIVHSPDEAPGGLAPLAPAFFPESKDPVPANPYRFVREAEGGDGTTLQIPLVNAGSPLANVEVGDLISVDFYGLDDPEDGVGHDNDPNKPMIAESRIQVTDYPITQADLDQGYYELTLPYTKLYYICYNLSVTNYSIKNKATLKNADPTYILFVLAKPGASCALP
jgi:hypothetical protein